MALSYADLIKKGKTIYTKDGKGFKDPIELAGALGIKPHEIDWTKITEEKTPTPTAPVVPTTPRPTPGPSPTYADIARAKGQPYPGPAPSVTPPVVPPTPPVTPPTPPMTPPVKAPSLTYADQRREEAKTAAPGTGIYAPFVNVDGTIYNKTTGKGYATPTELAADLGIKADVIEWEKILPGEKPIVEGPPTPPGEPGPNVPPEVPGAEIPDKYSEFMEMLMEEYKTKQEQAGGVRGQVAEVEELLDKLEGDLTAEMGGKLVTEPQRRRYLATRGEPLRESYADLLREQRGLEAGLGDIREYAAMGKEYYEYETPADKAKRELAEYMAKEKAEKEGGYAEYYQKPTTPTTYAPTSDMKEYEYAKKQGYTGTFEEWKNQQEKNTDADRITEVGQFINARKGTDGLIAAGTYVEAQKKWIGMEGTVADFKGAYPPESLMRETELKKLPTSIRPKPTEEEVPIAEYGDKVRTLFQQYKDAGWSKKDTLKKFMADNGIKDSGQVPSIVKDILKEVF